MKREPRDVDGAGGNAGVMAAAGARLEAFAATLSAAEREALGALIARAAGAGPRPASGVGPRPAPGAAPQSPLAELGRRPPADVLTADEAAHLAELEREPLAAPPGSRRGLTMVMKATRLCNLRCTYCHYWREGADQVMAFPVLARAVRDSLGDPAVQAVEFVWHGGEPTTLPPAFYEKALWLEERYRRPGQQVHNSVQTNATHLTGDWIDFLKKYRFDVGVSLDGPAELHDRRRIDVAGQPTAARVRAGLERLRAAGIPESGVLMVVDEDVIALGPDRLIAYLLEIGVRHVGLHNARPDNAPPPAATRVLQSGGHLHFERYIEFLAELFECWYPRHASRIRFRELADLMDRVTGGGAGTCLFAGGCHGAYLTIEPDGRIAACDKFIGDEEFVFGNLLEAPLADILRSERLAAVQDENQAALDRQRACPWFAACQGACPHDRQVSRRSSPGNSDDCCGYAPLLETISKVVGLAGEGRGSAAAAAADAAAAAGGVSPIRFMEGPGIRA